MIPAQKNLPLTMSQSKPSKALLEKSEEVLPDVLAPGMKNDAGQFNCFLNVVVQVSVPSNKVPGLVSQNTVSLSIPLVFNVMYLFLL